VAPADFEELCELSYTRVAKAAYLILGDRQEALDVAQEAFSRALERWPEVGSMENPQGWLYRVAVNLSLSTRRRAVRWVKGRIPDNPAPESEPSDPNLAKALSRLTLAQRAAVVLRFYSDLSIADTAQMLNKRPGTVRALTAQAISRLRKDLGPNWLEVQDEQPVQ
jgi:RNA polymerase sigma factor (sigma-70 family)